MDTFFVCVIVLIVIVVLVVVVVVIVVVVVAVVVVVVVVVMCHFPALASLAGTCVGDTSLGAVLVSVTGTSVVDWYWCRYLVLVSATRLWERHC